MNTLVLNPADDKGGNQKDARASKANLSDTHAVQLFQQSGISPDVAAERGYRTIRRRSEVPAEFKNYQRRAPALLIPVLSPDGISSSYQLRPDTPYRKKGGDTYRYASPAKAPVMVDAHPKARPMLRDRHETLWITEGIKKGDSLVSRGACAIALLGVWMFRKPSADELLECFDHVALAGRNVRIVFDSDVMLKPEVGRALECFATPPRGPGRKG